jgi:histidine kinase/DNA gyrase B/HSP90-like ATPase
MAERVMEQPPDVAVAWYRSFYWRIGVRFVVLVGVVLVLQSVFFGYWVARSNANDPEHSPNYRAARLAADLGTLLAQQPRQDLKHVFDRCYKVDGSRAASGNGHAAGSGLGLSIVKAIVERHGGTIAVTSVPGRSAFRIALPQSSTNL